MVHAPARPLVRSLEVDAPGRSLDVDVRPLEVDIRARHERWLLATRGFSAVLLTAFARKLTPQFSHPPDALHPNTWRELCRGLDAEDEHGDSLVIACAGMIASLDAPIAALRRVCAATHRAAWHAWPAPHAREFRERAALGPDDTALALSIVGAAAAVPARAVPFLSGEALLARTLDLLARELALSGIAALRVEPFADNTELLARAVTSLMTAEWALWDAGHERAASRVGLARAVIGTAVAGVWSRLALTSEQSARTAVAVLALLQTGRDVIAAAQPTGNDVMR